MNNSIDIIAIRQNDIHSADKAFAEFMSLTERHLNDETSLNHSLYKRCNGIDLEKVAVEALKQVAPKTPFRPENIELISGARFPDIVAERYYGVEVKSTKDNSWKSTGSSIVESTRIEYVSKIYMLFGNLGSDPAKFKCKPYEECLYNIAVTHSPRYLIDMELKEHNEPNIFDKINIPYDDFREYDENHKITEVRQYYKQKAAKDKKLEMPWWMGEEGTPVSLSFYNDLSRSQKDEIDRRMFILFPSIFNSEFKPAALWLCNRYALLCPNMRDVFTAGGKIDSLGNVKLKHAVPQIINRLYKFKDNIIKLLKNPDLFLIQDVCDYWQITCPPTKYYENWLVLINKAFKKNPALHEIDINEIFNL